MNEEQTIQAALAILETRIRMPEGVIRSPEDARRFAILKLAERPAEVFGVLFLNTRHGVIEFREMFNGTIDAASVHCREVVRAALEVNAAAMIFVHNHPSGDPQPSEADRSITIRLQKALELIDVRVLDHIVVGGTSTMSLAEMGWI